MYSRMVAFFLFQNNLYNSLLQLCNFYLIWTEIEIHFKTNEASAKSGIIFLYFWLLNELYYY